MTGGDQRWSREDVACYWRYAAAHREDAPRTERLRSEQSAAPLANFIATRIGGRSALSCAWLSSAPPSVRDALAEFQQDPLP